VQLYKLEHGGNFTERDAYQIVLDVAEMDKRFEDQARQNYKNSQGYASILGRMAKSVADTVESNHSLNTVSERVKGWGARLREQAAPVIDNAEVRQYSSDAVHALIRYGIPLYRILSVTNVGSAVTLAGTAGVNHLLKKADAMRIRNYNLAVEAKRGNDKSAISDEDLRTLLITLQNQHSRHERNQKYSRWARTAVVGTTGILLGQGLKGLELSDIIGSNEGAAVAADVVTAQPDGDSIEPAPSHNTISPIDADAEIDSSVNNSGVPNGATPEVTARTTVVPPAEVIQNATESATNQAGVTHGSTNTETAPVTKSSVTSTETPARSTDAIVKPSPVPVDTPKVEPIQSEAQKPETSSSEASRQIAFDKPKSFWGRIASWFGIEPVDVVPPAQQGPFAPPTVSAPAESITPTIVSGETIPSEIVPVHSQIFQYESMVSLNNGFTQTLQTITDNLDSNSAPDWFKVWANNAGSVSVDGHYQLSPAQFEQFARDNLALVENQSVVFRVGDSIGFAPDGSFRFMRDGVATTIRDATGTLNPNWASKLTYK